MLKNTLQSTLLLLALASHPAICQDEEPPSRPQIERELPEIVRLMQTGQRESISSSQAFDRIQKIDGHLAGLHSVADELFGDQDLRVAALEVLGLLGDESSVYPVLLILNDSNERARIRIAAIDAVSRIGDPRALMPLVDLIALEKRDDHTVGGPLDGMAYDPWADVKLRAARAIADFGAEESGRVITDRLVRYLTEEIGNPTTVAAAAHCLGLMKAESAAPDLRRILRLDKLTPRVRREVLVALGRIGDTAAIPELTRCLSHEDLAVRLEAINALGELGSAATETIDPLIKLYNDEQSPLEVRYTIPAALIRIDPGHQKVCETLVKTLGQRIDPPAEMAFDERAPWILHIAAKAALQFAQPDIAVPLLFARSEEESPTGETIQALLVHLTRKAFGSGQKPPTTRDGWQSWWTGRGEDFFENHDGE